ncbi:MAG: endonuclease domain-containing protein [Patescibacteria group bacterium]
MPENFLFNHKSLKSRRKELRNNATKAEVALWSKLKNSQLGFKFVRQYSAGPYILDFYCPKLRLAIELDGIIHADKEKKLYDKDRDEYLKSVDIKTIRFWNNDILKDMQSALKNLQVKLLAGSPPLKVRGGLGGC